MGNTVNALVVMGAVYAAYRLGRVHGLDVAIAIVRASRTARSRAPMVAVDGQ